MDYCRTSKVANRLRSAIILVEILKSFASYGKRVNYSADPGRGYNHRANQSLVAFTVIGHGLSGVGKVGIYPGRGNRHNNDVSSLYFTQRCRQLIDNKCWGSLYRWFQLLLAASGIANPRVVLLAFTHSHFDSESWTWSLISMLLYLQRLHRDSLLLTRGFLD